MTDGSRTNARNAAAEARSSRAAAPTVSVVIPCYQQAEYLPDAVSSVIDQTFDDWEIVIVDDGSTDDTAAVAERLIAAHPDRGINLLRQANQGLAAARNAGIAASDGRYVLPLDADDVIMPRMLERTVGLLEADPSLAIAYTDFQQFGIKSRRVEVGIWDLDRLAYSNQLVVCSLFRREVWEAVGGYNPNMRWGYEDWDFWIGAAERGYLGRRIPEPLFGYRVKEASMYVGSWSRRHVLRRQMARNHPAVFTPWRRLKHTVRHAFAALRYWSQVALRPVTSRLRRERADRP